MAGQRPLDQLSPRARPTVWPGRRPGPGLVAPGPPGEHAEQNGSYRDVLRGPPPVVCRCWSLRRAEVCALIPGPAPRKHAPPRTVLPPLCLMGGKGFCRAHRRIPPGIFGAIPHAARGGTHPDENGVVRAYTGSCDPTPVQGRSHSVLRARGAIWPGRRHEPLIVALVPRGARMADCCIRSMSPEWVASGGNHGDHLSLLCRTRHP